MVSQISCQNLPFLSMEEETILRKLKQSVISSQRQVIPIGLTRLAGRLYSVELEIDEVLKRNSN